jgi:hypothetical protein
MHIRPVPPLPASAAPAAHSSITSASHTRRE